MFKLNISSCKWLALTWWWCTIFGLILPRTPSWGWPIVVTLAGLIILLWSLLSVERSQQAIAKIFSKGTQIDSLLVGLPIISITVIFISIIRGFSKKLPGNVLQFTLLAVIFAWGWIEIALRTSKKLRSQSFDEIVTIIIVSCVSMLGIAIGWAIHSSLNGQIFDWFIGLLSVGVIVACIPDK